MALPKLNTPTYELTLPSTGEKVRYRPFLVKEHKVLLTMAEADNAEIGRIVKELVDTCTFNKLKVNRLPHFDIEYIFMNLRSKSIGENVNVVLNCECGEKIDASFNIEELEIVKTPDHKSKFMLTDDYGVEMRYPLFQDVVNIYETNDGEKIIELVTECIKGIFDKENYWDTSEQSKEEIQEFVNSLTKQQFEKIETFFLTAPKVVQKIEADCPSCKKHSVAKLEGLANFFV